MDVRKPVPLNDPQFVEAARVLAEKLFAEPDTPARVTKAFRLATIWLPAAKERDILCRLYEEQRTRFANQPNQSLAFVNIGDRPLFVLPAIYSWLEPKTLPGTAV